jgi:putative hydrolase of the HAD superfamily
MTFLFDIGRVLLDFSFEPSLARLFPNDATDYSERMEKMLERKDDFEEEHPTSPHAF